MTLLFVEVELMETEGCHPKRRGPVTLLFVEVELMETAMWVASDWASAARTLLFVEVELMETTVFLSSYHL